MLTLFIKHIKIYSESYVELKLEVVAIIDLIPDHLLNLLSGEASANICADTAYYEQMAGSLTRKLARSSYLGTLHTFGSIGTDQPTYLVRSQDRTFWVQVNCCCFVVLVVNVNIMNVYYCLNRRTI